MPGADNRLLLRRLKRLEDAVNQKGLTVTLFQWARRFYTLYPQIEKLFYVSGPADIQKYASVMPKFISSADDIISKLSFTHLREIMSIDDPLVRYFYEQECMRCTWSVRELRRQWFVPEGKRDTPIDPDSIWPEGCKLYGYSLSDRWPLAENCDGFETKEQIQRRKQLEEMRKTRK